jgi:hypothetical protein
MCLPIFLVGVAVSVAAFFFTRSVTTSTIKEDFRTLSAERIETFRSQLSRLSHDVRSLQALCLSSQSVTVVEFRRFGEALAPSHVVLLWIARETDNPFAIKCSVPDAPNAPHPGVDVSGLPGWRKAMREAQVAGGLRGAVLGNGDALRSIIALAPVYTGGEEPVTADERRERIRGFVGVWAPLGDVVEEGLSGLRPGGIDLAYTVSSANDYSPIYVHSSRTRTGPTSGTDGIDEAKLQYRRRIRELGLEWEIRCGDSPSFWTHRVIYLYLPTATLGGLLLATCLLTIGVRLIVLHIQRLAATKQSLAETVELLAADRRAREKLMGELLEKQHAIDRLNKAAEH